MTLSLTSAGTTALVVISKLSIITKSTKKQYMLGPQAPQFIVDMGYEGFTYKITTTLDTTEYPKWIGFIPGSLFTQTAAGTYTDDFPYTAAPNEPVFVFDSLSIDRKGGTIGKWDATITIVATTTATYKSI